MSLYLGKKGEDFAAYHLEQIGYTIIERNYHSRYGEIDIIAQKGEILAFVEVKTRKSDEKYTPSEAVTYTKQKKINLTALTYIAKIENENNCYNELQPRFDIVEVLSNQGRIYKVNHIENAFESIDFGGQYEIF